MEQPDILFIVLDTQRADRLGSYGYHRPTSPNLDHFASQAATFEQAISPAQWTLPSHASMFTGLYPTAHQLTQSNQSLSTSQPHLVEELRGAGYQTVGFCNNPLVGILNNGFKRGFETFYNYGGAVPTLPRYSSRLPKPLSRLVEGYTQFLRKLSYPIQNYFGRSDLAFRVSINSWLTPIWSRLANFKGQNERSVGDILRFLSRRESTSDGRPLFMFVNLMETHLPFLPPGEFVHRFAPYMHNDQEARSIMRSWNREAYRWAAPLSEPLSELERRVLSDMYDAEVAYQDNYLGPLFTLLSDRRRRDNTLTVIVSDHGDGLGEHGYFGHAFVGYQELIHVPLMVHWPREIKPSRHTAPVSTRRIYHTLLAASGAESSAEVEGQFHRLSLVNSINGHDPENDTALAEIYPPMNFVRAIENRHPELLASFRCLSERKAIVGEDHKLIQVDDISEELYDLAADPLELTNIASVDAPVMEQLDEQLETWKRRLAQLRDEADTGETVIIDDDEQLLRRLRGLGYVD